MIEIYIYIPKWISNIFYIFCPCKDCAGTILSAFAEAEKPGRLRFGIYQQEGGYTFVFPVSYIVFHLQGFCSQAILNSIFLIFFYLKKWHKTAKWREFHVLLHSTNEIITSTNYDCCLLHLWTGQKSAGLHCLVRGTLENTVFKEQKQK